MEIAKSEIIFFNLFFILRFAVQLLSKSYLCTRYCIFFSSKLRRMQCNYYASNWRVYSIAERHGIGHTFQRKHGNTQRLSVEQNQIHKCKTSGLPSLQCTIENTSLPIPTKGLKMGCLKKARCG